MTFGNMNPTCHTCGTHAIYHTGDDFDATHRSRCIQFLRGEGELSDDDIAYARDVIFASPDATDNDVLISALTLAEVIQEASPADAPWGMFGRATLLRQEELTVLTHLLKPQGDATPHINDPIFLDDCREGGAI